MIPPHRLSRPRFRPTTSQWVLSIVLALLAPAALVPRVAAQPPPVIAYQGRVTSGGVPFTGIGSFRFALVNGDASETYWTHDGVIDASGKPFEFVHLPVTNGLYSVRLGDHLVPFRMEPLPVKAFAEHDTLFLRVWFDDGTHGLQLLTPDTRLTSVGFALVAERITGKITENNIAPGSLTGTSLAGKSITANHLADNAVGSAQIADDSIDPAKISPAYGLWQRTGNRLFYNAGDIGIGVEQPLYPLHIARHTGDGVHLLLGAVPGLANASELFLGINYDGSGESFIQAVKAKGISYGNLRLNRDGGNVVIGNPGLGQLNAQARLVSYGQVQLVNQRLGIGPDGMAPEASLHVNSQGSGANTFLVGNATGGTWLTLGNTSPGGTNWALKAAGASTSSATLRGSLQLGPSPTLGVAGKPVLTLTTAGNVGIGSTPPSAPLHVSTNGQPGASIRVGGDPAVVGTGLIDIGLRSARRDGPYIQGVGASGQSYGSLNVNPDGGQVQIGNGFYSDPNSTLAVIQSAAHPSCAKFTNADGEVLVSVNLNGYSLHVHGEAHKNNGNPFWNTTSDQRLKTDIRSIGGALETLARIRPVTYRYNAEHRAKNPGVPGTTQFGVVAQEFAQTLPDFVTTDSEGYLGVNTSPLVFLNTAAIHELQTRLEERDSRLRAVEDENARLRQRLAHLEAASTQASELSDRLAAVEALLASRTLANNPPLTAGY